MISIVVGLRAFDVVYSKVKKCGGILITPFEGTYNIYKSIDTSDSKFKTFIMSLILKLFNITNEEYGILRDVISRSRNLCEIIDNLLNYSFRDVKLNYLIDILKGICQDSDKSNEANCIIIPPFDNIATFLSILILYYIRNILKSEKPVLCYVHDVDQILDIVLIFRKYSTYIFTCRPPRFLNIFDELYIQNIPSIPKECGVFKIRDDSIVRCKLSTHISNIGNIAFSLSSQRLERIDLEILSTLSELGFMSLQALRESISHQYGVDKSVVDKSILKLWRSGFIDIKYLPDGRAIVIPTLTGLVKTKEFC